MTRIGTVLVGWIGWLLISWPAAAGAWGWDQDSRTWRSVGPTPPAVEAPIAVDLDSRTVYLASLGGGVLKSVDGGASFAAVNQGLDSLTIAALAMVPHHPDVLYVSTVSGVFKTTDGGQHWYATGDVEGAVTLVLDPTNPNVVYAGLSPAGGVAKSTDGGASWADPSNGNFGPAVFSLSVDPSNPQLLYAGTQGSGGFKSTDGGATWTGMAVNATVVLIDPEDTNTVYAGTNGDGVYRSRDGGLNFSRVGSPRINVILSLAKSGKELFAGTATEGVSVSEDGGVSWRNTGVSPGLALILNVDAAGSVYLGTNFDGALC